MWVIVSAILAVFIILLLAGGCGYSMMGDPMTGSSAAPMLQNLKKKSVIKKLPKSKMSPSSLQRDRDVPKANF